MAPIKFDRRKKDATDVENRLAPVEIAEPIEHGSGTKLPLAFKSLLDAGENPVGYRREEWGTDAIHYTANRGARSLIVAFCAKGGMGVPVSSLLQMMREDIYDVLVLHDQHALFFDRGVVGFSDSFLDTVRWVEAFLSEKDYGEIITFGPSMGGYPALRAGLLLGANRAISVGGIFCWHVGRLLNNRDTTMAFDVMCPCFAGRDTELVAIASADRLFDSWSLKVVRRTFPNCHAVMIDAAEHNLMQIFPQSWIAAPVLCLPI